MFRCGCFPVQKKKHEEGTKEEATEFIKDKKYTITVNGAPATGKCKDVDNECKLVDKRDKDDSKKVPFTSRQKIILCLLAAVDFMSYCAISITAPLYPQEAELKGMSETLAGFVFSFYALIMFIFSPIFSKIIPKVGVKPVFIGGIIISGGSRIIFGFLEYIFDYATFTALSFAIRGLEALGSTAYMTAGFVLITTIFPHHAATVRGMLETVVAVGLSVGPVVGGLLFTAGGYGLPFYVVGILTLLLAPLNMCLLQSDKRCSVDEKNQSILKLLKLSAVGPICVVITVVSTTSSFIDPTLEPALRKFDLSATNIGLLFLLLSSTYGIACPVSGWVVDKMNNYWSLMTYGLIFSSISLLLLGPSPILPFLDEDSIVLNIVALCTLGVSLGLGLIPSFHGLIVTAVEGGLSDNLGTNSVVAGLWTCLYSLGEILGPAMGGALLEHCGFPIAVTVIAAINLITAIGITTYTCMKKESEILCERKVEEA